LVHPTGATAESAGLHQLGQAISNHTVSAKERRFMSMSSTDRTDWVHHPPSLDPFFATFIIPRERNGGGRYQQSGMRKPRSIWW
jgi:hypothetical protein